MPAAPESAEMRELKKPNRLLEQEGQRHHQLLCKAYMYPPAGARISTLPPGKILRLSPLTLMLRRLVDPPGQKA